MPLFYAETGLGCCIRRAKSEDHAAREILREVGTHEGVRIVREATAKDIAWVRGMGGNVPEDYRSKRDPK